MATTEQQRNAAPGTVPEPRRRGLTPRQRNVVAFGVIAFFFALPLRGLLRSQGPPMEEGFMLVFPERVLHGDLPNRDFLHLYGPGSLWVLAGWFKAFGVSLWSERLFGLLQQIGVVLGVYGLARRWGRSVALPCALISLVIIVPPIGLTALAWVGGVALGVLGLLTVVEARSASDPTRAGRLALFGGFLSAWALLYRPDLVLAVALGTTVIARGMSRPFVRRLLVGFGAGISLYLIHIFTAGPGAVFKGMVLDPLIYLRGGRRLPIPPPWSHLDGFLQRAGSLQQMHWPIPSFTASQQLTLWFFGLLASVATLVAVGVWSFRRDPSRYRARVLLAVALFSLGMVPQAVQRVDSAHFGWVGCVPVAFLPVALVEILRVRAPGRQPRTRGTVAGVGMLVALLLVIPYYTFRTYSDYTGQTFGVHRLAWKIERKGRVFYYGRPDVAAAAKQLLAKVDEIGKPGQRLLVGTTDLRKTPYSDAYLYYLLPEYPPGTYYIEMDPGVANRKGSKLAHDVATSDIVILSSVWNDWSEPNDSRKIGSDVPNQVLHRDFVEVGTYGKDLY
ncbi:MAG: hypothetical protein JOZ99_14790, partial [Actinobacteria bacterium]|nr:hypothetical protein [Actinomycetota bacterium]